MYESIIQNKSSTQHLITTVGIDVGKHQLDLHIRPFNIDFSVSNDAQGIQAAIQCIQEHSPERIVIEATGRLEQDFVIAALKRKLPVCVVNPTLIRKFAGALGQLAKTDALDAQLIALYGETIRPPITTLKPKNLTIMSDLIMRRQQLIKLQTMEKNRLARLPKALQSYITPILTAIKKQIDKVDKKLLKLMEQSETYKTKNAIIQSMPGIGNVVALSLLSNLPELGELSSKQAAALIGVAPINNDSGKFKGKRRIRGGRPQVRTVMYMAMLSAIQCNPVFKQKYQDLIANGKPKKVAIVACIRKMIVILNAMVKNGTMWEDNAVKA